MPDPTKSQAIWDSEVIIGSIRQLEKLSSKSIGYVYVDRNRGLKADRDETAQILEGGEAGKVPSDKICLFLLRTKAFGPSHETWWPQVRFPDGTYAFAFSI